MNHSQGSLQKLYISFFKQTYFIFWRRSRLPYRSLQRKIDKLIKSNTCQQQACLHFPFHKRQCKQALQNEHGQQSTNCQWQAYPFTCRFKQDQGKGPRTHKMLLHLLHVFAPKCIFLIAKFHSFVFNEGPQFVQVLIKHIVWNGAQPK